MLRYWKVCLFLLIFSQSVSAVIAAQNENLTQQMLETKDKLQQQEFRSRQILSTLYQIQVQIKSIVRKKSQLLEEKSQLQDNLSRTQTQITDQESLVVHQRNQLGKRIRSISQLKSQSLFQILLSSQEPHQLEQNLKILSIIAENDLQLIQQYNGSVKELALQKKQIAQRIEKLKSVEKKLLDQEKSFLQQQASRRIILDRFQNDRVQSLKKIEQLKLASRAQNEDEFGLLDPLLGPSFLDKKGALIWPLKGRLIRGFGLSHLQDQNLQIYNKGIFIESELGAAVKAVFGGEVVYAGDINGFGKTLIIDHGDHFYSVYSNVQELLVEAHTKVEENQKIASAGESAFVKDSGVYFEIRHFSEPTDPLSWMKGNSL